MSDAPKVELVSDIDTAEEVRKLGKLLREEERNAPRPERLPPPSLTGTYHCFVRRVSGGTGDRSYAAETITPLPFNMRPISAFGRSVKVAVSRLHVSYADALQEHLIVRDRMDAIDLAAKAQFPISEIFEEGSRIIL